MDSANVEQTILESAKPVPSFRAWVQRLRALRIYGLQVKLILPYLLLSLILATVGVFIITRLVADSAYERFENSLLDASVVANDGMVLVERQQLDKLRFLVFFEGMAQAVYDRDVPSIQAGMESILTGSDIEVITALDSNGEEILSYGQDFSTSTYHLQQGVDFSDVGIVDQVLKGTRDDKGDKFVQIVHLNRGPMLYTASPVRSADDRPVGVMLVGKSLEKILNDLKDKALADIAIVNMDGRLVATTLDEQAEGIEALEFLTRRLNPASPTRGQDLLINGRPYKVAYSPLLIREQQVGWIGVVKDSEYLVSETGQSRNLFVLLFFFGTVSMILVGTALAQDIARPLQRLRKMTQAVAAGDLQQSIGLNRRDEIGELGDAFDTMTQHLRERTEEANRLYAESLQRNKELAEINARLEAAQLQLIQSEKLASIGQLTAGIVHDVKNPFAVIMGMSEVLIDEESLDETTRHGLQVIRESAVKGNTIVSDLLKFARQSKPEMREMDLRETVESSMRLTAYLTRRYRPVADLPDLPVRVHFDAQQLEQVLINMIHNAVQAMPEGGMLRLAVWQEDGTARISIQDTGCGIPAENLTRVFDPFFTTKPEGEGTGLGLSVSYGIIANHRGRIDVESEPGKGTKFTIVLPIQQAS